MIIINSKRLENGRFEFQSMNNVDTYDVRAVYEAVRPVLSQQLNKEELVEFDAEFEFFKDLDFSELSADNFNLAYQTLISNPNNDKWLTPILPDLKNLMEADPRFKH